MQQQNLGESERPLGQHGIRTSSEAMSEHDKFPLPVRQLLQHTRWAIGHEAFQARVRVKGRCDAIDQLVKEFVKYEGYNPLERDLALATQIETYIQGE